MSKARRVRGSGYVVWNRARGVWVARRPVGQTPGGRTRYQEASDPSQVRALAKLAAMLPPGPTVTVGEWCERWLEGLQVRPGTRDNYTVSVRQWITPTLGHLRLATLTPYQIEEAARGWVTRDGAHPNSVRGHLARLHTALNAAFREGVLSANPVTRARKPKTQRKKIDPFTADQLAAIIEAATARPNDGIIALLAATGMRVGEAVALDVGDYARATGFLSITKTHHDKHGIGPPKSHNSVRIVRVLVQGRPAILAAAGKRTAGVLFIAPKSGDRFKHSALHMMFQRLQTRVGIEPARSLHQLRHSFISHAIGAGVPIADTARYAGDSVAMIFSRYVHPTGTDASVAMEKVLNQGAKHGASVVSGAGKTRNRQQSKP